MVLFQNTPYDGLNCDRIFKLHKSLQMDAPCLGADFDPDDDEIDFVQPRQCKHNFVAESLCSMYLRVCCKLGVSLEKSLPWARFYELSDVQDG